jgi:hypothetical protein
VLDFLIALCYTVVRGEKVTQQDRAVDKLAKAGWRVDNTDEDTVYLSKRDRKVRSMTHYCQVDKDGRVDGSDGK